MRNRAVREMIRSRCTLKKLSGTRMRPLPDSLPSFMTTFSISDGSCTSAVMGRTLNCVADSMNGREKNVLPAGTEFGLYMMATRASCGTIGHGDEHDRNGPRDPPQRGDDRGALAEDAVRLELHQLFRERLHARGIAFRIAVLDM